MLGKLVKPLVPSVPRENRGVKVVRDDRVIIQRIESISRRQGSCLYKGCASRRAVRCGLSRHLRLGLRYVLGPTERWSRTEIRPRQPVMSRGPAMGRYNRTMTLLR